MVANTLYAHVSLQYTYVFSATLYFFKKLLYISAVQGRACVLSEFSHSRSRRVGCTKYVLNISR